MSRCIHLQCSAHKQMGMVSFSPSRFGFAKGWRILQTRSISVTATLPRAGYGGRTTIQHGSDGARWFGFLSKYLFPWLPAGGISSLPGSQIYIANSTAVAERLYCFYGRDSLVLHPPIQLERFRVSDTVQSYYLVVSRLVAYKRIDLAIEACNRLGRKLKVIGYGPDRARLKAMAGLL